jgi:hypothetical protein
MTVISACAMSSPFVLGPLQAAHSHPLRERFDNQGAGRRGSTNSIAKWRRMPDVFGHAADRKRPAVAQ